MFHRSTKKTWQHSGSTISLVVKQVIQAILRCDKLKCEQPTVNDGTPEHISSNPKFYPYFRDCIGALDGCHVSAIVGPDEVKTFRNCKSFISQNVLSVVDFDMIFTYCLAGWEGSAYNGKVLDDALEKGMAILLNK